MQNGVMKTRTRAEQNPKYAITVPESHFSSIANVNEGLIFSNYRQVRQGERIFTFRCEDPLLL